ncbi:MAG: threonylcarbamoyl-AMP synthase [Deltaproteobacteria bacterium]|nr:threonylcarbamoyl-AMP synthase [Deltaproteobacteria bacterium]
MTSQVVKLDPAQPDPSAVARVVETLRRGGLVALPTETYYGLAADAANDVALGKVFEVKGRDRGKPLLLLLSHPGMLAGLVPDIPEAAQILMDRFWPGGLTLVLRSDPRVSRLVTGGTGTVAVRVTGHSLARQIIAALGRPVTGTSANLAGAPPCADPQGLPVALGDLIDLVVDAGPTLGGKPSTLVDVTTVPPRLLRPGVISFSDIDSLVKLMDAPA